MTGLLAGFSVLLIQFAAWAIAVECLLGERYALLIGVVYGTSYSLVGAYALLRHTADSKSAFGLPETPVARLCFGLFYALIGVPLLGMTVSFMMIGDEVTRRNEHLRA